VFNRKKKSNSTRKEKKKMLLPSLTCRFLSLFFVVSYAKKTSASDQPMTISLLGDTTGGTFTGPLVDGKPHGEGVFRVGEGPFDGGKIVGVFVDGSLSGEGKGFGGDGNLLYEGTWLNGLPHGQGVSYFPNSKTIKYEGEFQYGKSHGVGKTYGADGKIHYEGEWHGGHRHGKGTLHHDTLNPTAERHDGFFENGHTVTHKVLKKWGLV
jgi:hypothetical protein